MAGVFATYEFMKKTPAAKLSPKKQVEILEYIASWFAYNCDADSDNNGYSLNLYFKNETTEFVLKINIDSLKIKVNFSDKIQVYDALKIYSYLEAALSDIDSKLIKYIEIGK